MTEPSDFHVHLYFDPHEVDHAREVAADIAERFGAAVGHFHTRPVGPHPRGSVQLTVAPDRFGDVAAWLPLNRRGLTVFAHPSTGDDRSDHVHHVIWFGPSEPLKTEMFDRGENS
ncbi:DOPA 4,5-dioxygenase family protein [Sphingomonas sp. LHG3406-1]|uniref:DOPA 4,5-dioxygenase family protein n=1 Tax=Sphingomonas sp. LHG3406-1 TaxID=2804617 RepID=UPI00260E7494|nr:DOPA 4,5-dioxygenase family protein [Sphingomonas sp. LHG3406-1]